MSVNGLEKITDRIRLDAEARTAVILEQAKAECEKITADSNRRAEEIRRRLTQEAETKATALIAETKSTAQARRNEVVLAEKSRLVEQVFEDAFREILSLDSVKYTELLGGLLAAAIFDFCRTEAENRAIYGDDEETGEEPFEVILNKKDRDTCGEAVLESVKRRLPGKVPEDALKNLTLSRQMNKMQGGVILRHGPVELNCSFEMLFAQLKRELESEVSGALFDFRGNGI